MKLHLIAVGQRMPDWAEAGFSDYAKRFPPDMPLLLKAIKTEPRNTGKSREQLMDSEAERMTQAIPKGSHVVAMDERGRAGRTRDWAHWLARWQQQGSDVVFLMGGPDGLAPAVRERSHECLRLSDLTLPHALARVLLVEQLYRAWALSVNHPYHRE